MPRHAGPRAFDGTGRAGRQWILVNAEDAEELFDPAAARQHRRHRNEQTAAQAAQRSNGQGRRASRWATLPARRTRLSDHSAVGVGSTASAAKPWSNDWHAVGRSRKDVNEDEMAVVTKLTYNNNVGVITVYRLRITDYD